MSCIKTVRAGDFEMSVDICKMIGYCELDHPTAAQAQT